MIRAVAPGRVFMIVAPGLAAMCGAAEAWSGSLFAPVPGGDGGRWLPEAICAEIFWNPDDDWATLLERVMLRPGLQMG